MSIPFKDRDDAAAQLAEKLGNYRGKDGIVLAVPRGGVPIGYVIAKALSWPLEIILSKKIGHPYNPELAVGSVNIHGAVISDNILDVDADYIQREAGRIHKELEDKFRLYMGKRKPTALTNKTVIVVDDGAATGNTLQATVHAIRKEHPGKIIIAIPVSPKGAITKLEKVADEVICLHSPENFYGVGQFYLDFSQVSDQEVIDKLKPISSTLK